MLNLSLTPKASSYPTKLSDIANQVCFSSLEFSQVLSPNPLTCDDGVGHEGTCVSRTSGEAVQSWVKDWSGRGN